MDLTVDLPDYRDDAEAYEIEERSRPDEMLMLDGAGEHAAAFLSTRTNARVLDLCCGTGLSLRYILNHADVAQIVGVDISDEYLSFAKEKCAESSPTPEFVQFDAVDVQLPEEHWDVIMLCSAYHHIEDSRKLQFLKKVRRLLKPDGIAVFAENILPNYEEGSEESYANAVKEFYTEVLDDAVASNPDLPDSVRGLISRVAKYGVDGDYEYKVHYKIFQNHLAEAGLVVAKETCVWPTARRALRAPGGNYVLVATRS